MPKKTVRKTVHKKVTHKAPKQVAKNEEAPEPQIVSSRIEPQAVPKEVTQPTIVQPQIQEIQPAIPETPEPAEQPVEEKPEPQKTIDVGEAIDFGWQTTKKHLGFFIGVGLFILVLSLISGNAKGIATKILVGLFQVGVTLGYLKLALDLVDNKPAAFKELFSAFKQLPAYIITFVIYGLTVLLGLVLLVIPGIIWAIAFGLYPFVILLENAGPMTALRKSAHLTEGVKPKLLVFYLALLGLNILGTIPIGLGLFVTMPISLIAAAHVYRQLEKQSQQ
ncbi:hypothetical protein HY489_01315 [Candidatus Woesearchaeota archaeon]|nr:hypothetical protein [Candidatus Woesearchaeota archaeon]